MSPSVRHRTYPDPGRRTIDRVDTTMREERLEASISALFRRCPARELRGEIVAVLAALIEECPEAGELLRERTFARAFH